MATADKTFMSLLSTQRELLIKMNNNSSKSSSLEQHQQQQIAAAAEILGNPHFMSNIVIDPSSSSSSVRYQRQQLERQLSSSLLGSLSSRNHRQRRFSLSHGGGEMPGDNFPPMTLQELEKIDKVLLFDHLINNNNNNLNNTIHNHTMASITARTKPTSSLSTRRFSLSMGLGEASDHFPTLTLQDLDRFDISTRSLHPNNNENNMMNNATKSFLLQDFSTNKLGDRILDISESIRILKKRRLSGLGLLSSSFFDDVHNAVAVATAVAATNINNHNKGQSRRYSISHSMHNNYSRRGGVGDNIKDSNAVDLKSILLADESMRYPDIDSLLAPLAAATQASTYYTNTNTNTAASAAIVSSNSSAASSANHGTSIRSPRVTASSSSSSPILMKDTMIIPIDTSGDNVKKVYAAFSQAMAESQKSQQSIHDWDKKMGLKRSHSKTMRLSMRTRKRLRMIMKREMHSMK